MLYRLRRSLAYWRFDRAIAGILATPPLALRPAPWTIVSMVAAKHVPMYLLSLKAFYARIGAGQVVAIVARDAPEDGKAILRRHVPGIELVTLEDIDTGACQRGGTWERLVYCLTRAEREFVVQLDADAFACGPDLDEVRACLESGRPFVLADGQPLLPVAEAAARARAMHDPYVGTRVERVLDRLPGAAGLRYVRASSALAGYARGGFPRAAIEAFHRDGERLLGAEAWREWGTEQCASNFAVANMPDPLALPVPAYTNHVPGRSGEGTKLFHFLGSHRFDDGLFARLGQREIARLAGATRLAA
ncbi:MAG: hypothetical protein K2X11_07955 [Acetobacteraceae bacterium]|nr:hypothetical protein [Acetobacteraceae bacterium]